MGAPGATQSHKQCELKASGMVDAPQALQDVGWRAGLPSGLAVPWVSPRLALASA